MRIFAVPEDKEILAELGILAIRHVHFEHIQKMILKSLQGFMVEDTLKEVGRKQSKQVRELIKSSAEKKLDEKTLKKILELIDKCRKLSEERNKYIHAFWSRELDGPLEIQTLPNELSWQPAPSLREVKNLSKQIEDVTREIININLEGWLFEALENLRKEVKDNN